MACLRNVREQPSQGSPPGWTRSDSIAPAPGAYGRATNVDGSGMMRTSPTGPIPSTGCRESSMDMAIIATVCPIPVRSRDGSMAADAALPRMMPPWSAYRNRTRETCSAWARSTTALTASSSAAPAEPAGT